MTTQPINVEDYNINFKTNWKAYFEAKVNNGEECYECKTHLSQPKGCRSLCYECSELANEDDYISQNTQGIRCPSCRHILRPDDNPDEPFHEEGGHNTICPSCNEEFEFETHVEYSWSCPAIKVKNDTI